MRIFFYGLFLPLVLVAQQNNAHTPAGNPAGPPTPPQASETKPEDRCSIAGQVLRETTGEPIKKANVILRRADVSQNATNFPPSYSTSTDASGSFAMKDIEPGKYRLSVTRTGFVSSEYGARGPNRPGTTLSLVAQQSLRNLTLRLTPHGVITGHVVDADGEPLAGVQVTPMRYRFIQGRKQLSAFGFSSTNDLGEYRVYGLAPGRYYVCATYRNQGVSEPAVDRSANPIPEEGFVPIYYPGAADPASASTLDVSPGGQLRGINFTLSKSHTIRIKGHVENLSGNRNPAYLTLVPRGSMTPNLNRPNQPDAKGDFEIRGVAPGAYTLYASIYDGEHSVTARQQLEAGGGNIDDVLITLRAGMSVPGDVRVEGQATADLSLLRVSLRPREMGSMMFGPMSNGQVKNDGTFSLSNAGSDLYTVDVRGLPDGYYVRAIRSGDDDVLTNGLDLSKGAVGTIHIVLSPNAGQLEGSVQNDKQQPAAGATIALLPQEKERQELTSYYRSATTDQYGRFTVKNIDPGEYKVFAWEDVESGAYFDPDFVKPVENLGETITIRESSHEQRQLKLIPSGAEKEKAASN